jgi:hypothetical protein
MEGQRTFEQQEASARHHIRWVKAFYAAVGVGAIFLLLSRTIPWWSAGVPEGMMGRVMKLHVGWMPDLLFVGMAHMAVSIVYGLLLAAVIYRFNLLPALGIAVLVGLGLYLASFLIVWFFSVPIVGSEISAMVTHVVFSLFFTAVYKAISVPEIAPRSPEARV